MPLCEAELHLQALNLLVFLCISQLWNSFILGLCKSCRWGLDSPLLGNFQSHRHCVRSMSPLMAARLHTLPSLHRGLALAAIIGQLIRKREDGSVILYCPYAIPKGSDPASPTCPACPLDAESSCVLWHTGVDSWLIHRSSMSEQEMY